MYIELYSFCVHNKQTTFCSNMLKLISSKIWFTFHFIYFNQISYKSMYKESKHVDVLMYHPHTICKDCLIAQCHSNIDSVCCFGTIVVIPPQRRYFQRSSLSVLSVNKLQNIWLPGLYQEWVLSDIDSIQLSSSAEHYIPSPKWCGPNFS